MSNMTGYNKFAEFYDLVCGNSDKFVKHIKEKIVEYKPKIETVLEIACGTGNVIISFSKKYDCWGIDLSKKMLKIAKKKSKRVKFRFADITNFKLNKKFDLIFCVYDSINHLLTKNKWMQTFNSVHKHLNKNGLFIFDMNTVKGLKSKKGVQIYRSEKGNVIIKINPLPQNKAVWDIKMIMKANKNKHKMYKEQIYEKSFKVSEVKKMLEDKFKILELSPSKYGNLNRVFFLCQKK